MNKNRLALIKNSKPFKPADVFLYVALLALILALLFSFVIFKKSDASGGFKVLVKGEEIFRLYYDKPNEYTISSEWTNQVNVSINGYAVKVTIYLDGEKTEYNVLEASLSEKSVRVTDSTCSLRKDCVHTSPVSTDSDVIICAPHYLKILSVSSSGYVPPTTGGA